MKVMYLLLLLLLLIAVYTDMTKTIISNRLIIVGLILGLFFRVFGEEKAGILVYIVNISIPVILLYLLFCTHALGAGDIKLFSMIGAFISTEQLLQIMLMAFVAGAVMGIMKLVYRRLFSGYIYGKLTQIHFSPAILFAYLISSWRCING